MSDVDQKKKDTNDNVDGVDDEVISVRSSDGGGEKKQPAQSGGGFFRYAYEQCYALYLGLFFVYVSCCACKRRMDYASNRHVNGMVRFVAKPCDP